MEKREQKTIGCFCEVSVIHLTNIVTKIEPSEYYWRQLKTAKYHETDLIARWRCEERMVVQF